MDKEPGCSRNNNFSCYADRNTGVPGASGDGRGYDGDLADNHSNERLMETRSDLFQAILRSRISLPIGLRLPIPAILDEMHGNPTRTVSKAQDVGHSPNRSKSQSMKASNFPATSIKIGTWQKTARHEGDLVAKCYFAKKKLVWELLKRGLKSKIEIQWSNIIGLRFISRENEIGILDIELRSPPCFFDEVDPLPRKHTVWKVSEDFTEGQASRCRIHNLRCPPGILERPIEKLFQCEPQLLKLSRQRFPTMDNPYYDSNTFNFRGYTFSTGRNSALESNRLHSFGRNSNTMGLTDYTFGYGGCTPGINIGKTCHLENVPSLLVPAQPVPVQSYASKVQPYMKATPSLTSVKEFSHSAELLSNKQISENQRKTVDGPGFSSYANACPRGQLQGSVSAVPSNRVRHILGNSAVNYGLNQLQQLGYAAATPTRLSQIRSNHLDNYSRDQLQEQTVSTQLSPVQSYSSNGYPRDVPLNQVSPVQSYSSDGYPRDMPLNQVSPVQSYSSDGYPRDLGVLKAIPVLSRVNPTLTQVSPTVSCDNHNMLTGDEGIAATTDGVHRFWGDAPNETMIRVVSLTELDNEAKYENSATHNDPEHMIYTQSGSSNGDYFYDVSVENADVKLVSPPQYPTMYQEWNSPSYDAFDISCAAMFGTGNNFNEQNHWNRDTMS